jgi:hypothetical protein
MWIIGGAFAFSVNVDDDVAVGTSRGASHSFI